MQGKNRKKIRVKIYLTRTVLAKRNQGTPVCLTQKENCYNKSSGSGKQHICNERPHKKSPEQSGFSEKVSIHGVKVEC